MINILPLSDKRMNWIRAMERSNSSSKHYVDTYEFFSECHTPGIANYGDGFLLCGGMYETGKQTSENTYQLALKFAEGMSDTIEAGKDGIGLHTSTELLSLISLHLHARCFPRSITTDMLTEHGIPSKHHLRMIYWPIPFRKDSHIPELFKDKGNFCELPTFLEKITKIKPEYHRNLIYAIYNYADGVRWIGVDDEVAYIKLLIAVEILSNDEGVIADDLNSQLENLKSEIDNQGYKNEIHSFQRQRRIKQSFIQFILDHRTDFLISRGKDGASYITEDNLKKTLAHIYSGRSSFVHGGRPMAISRLSHFDWDIDPWVERSITGTLETKEKEKMPTPIFFESLIRHCILHLIEELPSLS